MNEYTTIAAPAEYELIEKKSRFISYALPVRDEVSARASIDTIKAEHRLARHHVHAYVLKENNITRSSDDGEPAKTAGLPTLEVLTHAQIFDCLIVTVRYFGGILLGTGGLVRAYGAAAQGVIDAAVKARYSLCKDCFFEIPYSRLDEFNYAIESMPLQVLNKEYAANVSVHLRGRLEDIPHFEQFLVSFGKGQIQCSISEEHWGLLC